MPQESNTHNMLVKALGIESLPLEKQEEIIGSAGAIIYQAVITRALEEMTDEVVDEFEKLTETEPTPDQMFAFFRQKIPNFDGMIEEEASLFIKDGEDLMRATD